MYCCKTCNKTFDSVEAKHKHWKAKHEPSWRRLSAKDRPKNRGDVPCGICEATFANAWSATQHRRALHGALVQEAS